MSVASAHSLRYWRWLFLALETVVFVTFLGGWLVERFLGIRWEPQSPAVAVPLVVALVLSWLFLLIVSPFFLRSLRGIALAGWIIAMGIFLLMIIGPVR
jgi:protein-S-isoprenylcysteine O-methyltransferase Ste14